MFGLGTWEIALILVAALIFIGPGKLPDLARSLGKGMREMRRAMSGLEREFNEATRIPEPGEERKRSAADRNTGQASGTVDEADDDDAADLDADPDGATKTPGAGEDGGGVDAAGDRTAGAEAPEGAGRDAADDGRVPTDPPHRAPRKREATTPEGRSEDDPDEGAERG